MSDYEVFKRMIQKVDFFGKEENSDNFYQILSNKEICITNACNETTLFTFDDNGNLIWYE